MGTTGRPVACLLQAGPARHRAQKANLYTELGQKSPGIAPDDLFFERYAPKRRIAVFAGCYPWTPRACWLAK